MSSDHVLVFAGGDPSTTEATDAMPRHALVIAADSGAVHAAAAGRHVDVLVGDLDSIPAKLLADLSRSGTEVQRYPAAKDATDLALALDAAVAKQARRITVVGGHGGRLDHLMANLLLFASPDYASVQIDAVMGKARVLVVRNRWEFEGHPRELVTLLAVGGPATGVTTEGLLFSLHDARLVPGSSRGVSNQMVGDRAAVEVSDGVVMVILPGYLGNL